MQDYLVMCDNLIKIYKQADLETVALQGLDLDVLSGEMIAIVGASGSGKSTLLNILSGLDTPSAGRAVVAGHELSRMKELERTNYRSQVVGYVWQQSGRNLLADFTAEENIAFPQILNGVPAARRNRRTRELLEVIGLSQYAKYKPAQLSGGQQQRVAIAVALANNPALLLADEPTGELDSVTAQDIIAFLRQLNRDLHVTIIIVTHDVTVATQADRTIAIRDGRTSTETVRRDVPVGQSPSSLIASQAALAPEMRGSAVIGLPEQTHQEAIFIDRAGLLQLPADAFQRVALRGRVEVRVAQDHVELWPAGMGDLSYRDLPTNGTSAVIGLPLTSHSESVLVDRAGRLQLPQEALLMIPFQGRAYVRVARSHIQLWPSPPVTF